jgi:thioredoxin-like negative regulator of GroEL
MNKNIILIIFALIIIIVLSATNSTQEPFDSDDAKPVLALYYTNWCHYSKLFLNEWKKIEISVLRDSANLVKYDCDKDGDKCANITAYPTIILYKNGAPIYFPETLERTADNVIAYFENYL